MVKILYVGNCPDKSNRELITEVRRGDRVNWQSVEKANGGTVNVGRKYSILFDPFVGNTIVSDANGAAKSIPINVKTAQGVEYKYTVVSPDDEHGAPTCEPLDPRIRVKH